MDDQIEQATAAPGEKRNICSHCRGEMKVHEGVDGRKIWCPVCGGTGTSDAKRCHALVHENWPSKRCTLIVGHAGPHEYYKVLAEGSNRDE